MTSKLTHSVSYPFGADRLWEVIATERYWRDLLEATNAGHGRLNSFSVDGDTVTVDMQQGIAEDQLPSMITAVRSGDLEIPRATRFTRAGEGVTGTMTATVKGSPAKVQGTLTITGDPATTEYGGSVEVSIPFVGGKIERAIIEQLAALLDAERDATVTWEADNR